MIVVFRKFRKLDFLFLSLNFEHMIDIRDISGRIKLSVSIGSSSLHRFELMKEDYISIVFSLETPVRLEIGDNVDYEGSLYYITDKVYPTFNTSNGGYDYTLRLESHYYRWKNHILFYDRQGNKEASWSLTRSPEAHLSIVVSNLRAIGFTFKGKEYQAIVDSTVDPVAKLVQYNNTNIIDALTKIAEAWECEWWVDGDKIYLGHLEHGEPVNLEIGKEISSMSRSQSQDIFATRLYAFGSSRNLPSDYRKGETGAVVEGVVQKRLMLPAGTPYVDVIEGLEEEQVVEAVIIFEDIYPRVTGTITEVIPKEITDEDDSGDPITFTVYRFKDANLTFKKEYILPGQDLHVIFQTGPLSGMDFALEFNPERLPEDNPEAQVFEIVRNDTYGQTLPESPLIPGIGNKYILYNFDTRYVNDALIPQAEQELLERTIAYKDKVVSDPSTYTCSLNSYRASGYDENNGLLNPEKEINLLPGQKVNLINKAYFENGRISRVIGFEKKLDIPYDSPVYTIGESAAYSRLGELEQKLDNIQFKGNTYVNQGGGFGVYIVKKDDATAASDENVFSALRTLYEINKAYVDISDMYLRKDIDDTAHGNILFDKKIGSSIFIDGWDGKGWDIQSTGAAILDSLRVRSDIYIGGRMGSPSFISGFPEGTGWDLSPYTITNSAGVKETRYRLEIDDIVARKSARFYEMIISQLRGENDNVMFSGQMKVAYYDSAAGRLYLDTELGILYNPFRPGDLLEVQRYNGIPSSDNNYYITKQYELQVEEVGIGSLADGEDRLDWITFKNFVGNLSQIAEGDILTRVDSATDSTRKGIVKITTIDELGTPHISAIYGMKTNPDDSLLARLGNCAGVRTKNGIQLTEQVGLYARGAFFENSTIVLQNGDTIEQTFIAMNGKFESLIDGIRNDISAEGGNILVNSSFSQNTNYWTAVNNVHFINVGGEYLWLDGSFYVEKDQVADIYNDNGQNVLRIRNTYILQQNAIMNIPDHTEEEEKTYSFSLFYKVLRPGSCGFGIPGTELYHEEQLPESDSYQKLSKVGKWNGKGDFELRFTGEILIYGVGLFSDEIADAIVKLQTQIDQTDEYIKLLATKDYVDNETGEIYVHFDSQLQITAEQMSGISTKVDNINNTIESAGWITQADGVTLFAKKEMESGKAIVNAINVGTGGILIQANRINLVGAVSFTMLSDYTDVNSRINGKVDESDLGTLAYASSISKNNFASSLLQEFNGKANSSSLKALAYLDKVEQAQLGSTIISGGHIITSLIDTDSIYANQAYIGNFTITADKWLKCEADLDGSIGYIVMKGTNTEVSFGQDLIPSSTGGAFTLTAYIKNSKSNYLHYDGLLKWDPTGNKNIGLQIVADNCDYPVAIYSQGFNSFTGGLSVVTFMPSVGNSWNSSELRYKDIFVIQANRDSYLTLPTLAQLQAVFSKNDYYSNGLAFSYQAVIKFTFILTRYSSKVYFRGVSGIPIIGTAGSIYGSGNYAYGQYEATPGTIVTFYYFNNNYYIDSNAF